MACVLTGLLCYTTPQLNPALARPALISPRPVLRVFLSPLDKAALGILRCPVRGGGGGGSGSQLQEGEFGRPQEAATLRAFHLPLLRISVCFPTVGARALRSSRVTACWPATRHGRAGTGLARAHGPHPNLKGRNAFLKSGKPFGVKRAPLGLLTHCGCWKPPLERLGCYLCAKFARASVTGTPVQWPLQLYTYSYPVPGKPCTPQLHLSPAPKLEFPVK